MNSDRRHRKRKIRMAPIKMRKKGYVMHSGSYFCNNVTKFDPVRHLCSIITVNKKRCSVVTDRFEPAGIRLTKPTDIGKSSCFIDEYSGIAVTDGLAADQ